MVEETGEEEVVAMAQMMVAIMVREGTRTDRTMEERPKMIRKTKTMPPLKVNKKLLK